MDRVKPDLRRAARSASPRPETTDLLPAPDGVALGRSVHRPALSRDLAAGLRLALDAVVCIALLAIAGLLPGVLPATVAALGLVIASSITGRSSAARLAVTDRLLEELPRFNHVAVVTTLLLLVATSVAGHELPTAPGIIATWAFVVAACAVSHAIAARLHRSFVVAERCLLVGPADRRERFRRCAATSPGHRLDFVGDAGFDDIGRGDGLLPTIEEVIARHRATRVVVLEGDWPWQAAQAARRARNAGARVSIAQEAIESVGPPEHVEQLGSAVLLNHSPTAAVAGPMGKRALDAVGAGLGLLVLAPLLALIALAIRLTSKGPVLFWQDRIGLNGERFRIAKFRTMVLDAEARKAALHDRNEAGGGLFKLAEDPRVTRVGRLLRRMSLDELPQLLNVLRGEMSLVGPRPLVTDEDALIGGWHRDRLHLKPGMTGRWQVMGSARIPLHEMVRLDQQYVASWTLWQDVQILLRTALFVVRRRGI